MSTLPAIDLISFFVRDAGFFSPLEAIFATLSLVFSFLATGPSGRRDRAGDYARPCVDCTTRPLDVVGRLALGMMSAGVVLR